MTEDHAANAPATQTARVLVVDDEPQIRKFLEISLRAQGYAVETAATTEAAAIEALVPSLERIGFSQNLLWFVIVRRRRAQWVSRCSCWLRAARFSMPIICSLPARATRFWQPECAFFSLFKILRCNTLQPSS